MATKIKADHDTTTFFWRLLTLLLLLLETVFFCFGRGPSTQLLLAFSSHHGGPQPHADKGCDPAAAPPFWALGVTVVTDKVTLPPTSLQWSHTYQFAYERYLRPRRCEPLRLLEIGLGCGMPYNAGGPVAEGHSIPLWLAFLPRANISIFEYKADAARAFFQNDPLHLGADLRRRVRLFTGDQSKEADLRAAMAEMGEQDIIVDDGGHSMLQQQTSLRVLFHYLKPGGLCACGVNRAPGMRMRVLTPQPSFRRHCGGPTDEL